MFRNELPLFPLPNVVLFPATQLPLHIFEPRYRAMVADALEGERLIGMVMLRPGWESSYNGTPAVYPIGCAGFITHADRLPDGRYNIILRGVEKFRIVDERLTGTEQEAYRIATVQTIEESPADASGRGISDARAELERLIAKRLRRSADDTIPKDIPDEDLVHAIAQYLEPVEKQALLECDGFLQRCRTLIELLEMRMSMTSKTRH